MTGLKSVHVSLNVEVKQLLYNFVLNPLPSSVIPP